MIRLAFAVFRKDLRLSLLRGNGLLQALLLGLLLVFTFSLARGPGGILPAEAAAAIFWLASVFCQVLIFNQLYAFEEANLSRLGLWLVPSPVQGVWLGKALAGYLLLLLLQAVFLPATVVFLGQNFVNPDVNGLAALFLVDLGLCAAGSLMGALSQAASGKESLLSIILFPLLMPLLLAGTAVGAHVFGAPAPDGTGGWLGLAGAFDAVFLGAGLLLFGFLYSEED